MVEIKRSLAVVVGINRYMNGIPELKTAVNDACKLAQIVEGKYQYQVLRLLDGDATGEKFNEVLAAFEEQQFPLPDGGMLEVGADDRLLFYFAGHGIALDVLDHSDDPAGYLVLQDAHLNDRGSLMSMQRLHDALLKLPCRHLLVILDCCFAGAFRWAGNREAVRRAKMYQERYARFISGCAQQVITSAADDEKAADILYRFGQRSESSEHSPFAELLFRGLDEAADLSKDGVITGTELYVYLQSELGKLTAKQTPGFCQLKRHNKGEYIFTLPGFEPKNLPPAPALDESTNPYRGLESFEEKHSKLFFGRKAIIAKLEELVSNQPLTVVLGSSGSGKSSLVKAGLIPQLKNSGQEWRILAPFRPGASPFTALNNTLIKENLPLFTNPREAFEQELQILAASVKAWSELNPQAKLLFVINQFEELVTLCRNESERSKFLDGLKRAIKAFPQQLRIVITLRSDFEPQFRDALLDGGNAARFIVPGMTREELREAIIEPATAKVMYFDPPSLVDNLIDEVAQTPGALPLLSFTLSELYLKYIKSVRLGERNNRAIALADYEELGGVTRSLTQRADCEYDELVKLDPAYAQTIKHVMLRMVAVSGGQLARRQVLCTELHYPEPENTRVQSVIEHFVAARLLVKGRDTEDHLYVEPAHDALVRGWQKLRTWKDQELGSLLLQRELTPTANKWTTQKSDKRAIGLLWNNDPRLPLVEQLLQSDQSWLNSKELEFVQRSIQRRQNNRSRLIVSVIAVILGLTGLGIFAFIQNRQSQLNAIDALVASSDAYIASNQELKALIASMNAAEQLKHSFWVKTDTKVKVAIALSQAMYKIRESKTLQGHKDWVNAVAFSPDGQMLASASQDKTIKLWRLNGQEITTLQGHQDAINAVSFSPNGQMLASASQDKTVRLWNLDGKLLRIFPDHTQVMDVTFSPNGQILASASADTVKLWNLNGKLLHTLRGHTAIVENVNFSPDGQTIASASNDGKIMLWSLNGVLIRTIAAHKGVVSSINFSPNGATIASAGADNTVKLWNLNGTLLKTLKGHTDTVYSVHFSPNGQMLASASKDKTVKLWNLDGKLPQTFYGHKNEVTQVRFSPDGKTIASSSKDLTVKLWSVNGESPIILRGHNSPFMSIRFSPNGKLFASSSKDGTVKLWTPEGKIIQNFHEHRKKVRSVSFSPDSQNIASASDDGTIMLHSVSGKLLKTLRTEEDKFFISVNFSLDGKTIVSTSDDGSNPGKIKLWNKNGILLQTIADEKNRLWDASISPDGKMIASAGYDGTIKLWSLNGILLQKIPAHKSAVRKVIFSPDGQIIASGSDDGTVILWKRDGKLIANLISHGDRVLDLSFSSDGQIIASTGLDKTINISSIDGTLLDEFLILKGSSEILSVSFSPNGKLIAWANYDQTVTLWNLDLDDLILHGCKWLHNYLETKPDTNENLRCLCNQLER